MAWSVDVDSYDWKRIGADHMLHHTLADLEKRRGGILLMHDVQPKTALMLPALLAELKARGYRIVHVVPSGGSPELVAGTAPVLRHPEPVSRTPMVAEPREREPSHRLRHQAAPYAHAEPVPPPRPGGNGLFEAIFTPRAPRWGR